MSTAPAPRKRAPTTAAKAPAKKTPVKRTTAQVQALRPSRADRICQFIEKYVYVPEGALVGKPMKLLPEQREFIEAIYNNVRDDGKLVTRRGILSVARKNGKALAVGTAIPTPSGWTTMGALRVGDYVLGANGFPTKVTFKSTVHYGHTCYRVFFDDGTSVIADAEHQWYARCGGGSGEWKTYTTSELLKKQYGSIALPLPLPLELPDLELDIPPYTLGFWLGDGSSNGASITVADKDFDYVLPRIESELGFVIRKESAYRKPGAACVTINMSDGVRDRTDKTKLKPRLRELGVLHNKHIPAQYLRAGAAQRWALLQGLMDSDGSCDLGNGNPRCCFSNKNQRLAREVFELAKSLGLKATFLESWDLVYGDGYGVTFNAFSDQPVFGLSRKQSRLRPRPEKTTRSMLCYIRGIEEIESTPTQCIQVDASDSLYLAGRGFSVTHNTGLIAALLEAHLIGPEQKPNSQIYSAARSRDQASLVFNYAAKSLRMNPNLENLVQITDSSKKIVGLRNNTSYKAMSADATTAHGLSPALTIHDELGQVVGPTDKLYDAFETAGGAQAEPLSLIISTQAANDADLLSILIDDALRNPTPETVVRLYAAAKDDDVFDPEVWKRVNFALGIFRSYEEFAEMAERAKRMPSTEPTFRNLYLNMRVALQSLLVPPTLWKENDTPVDDYLFSSGLPVHFALDLSQRTDLTAAVASVQDPDTGIVHLKPFIYTPADGLEERAKVDRAPYTLWADQRYLITTGGRVVSYEQVASHLRDNTQGWNIASVGFDRWRIELFKKAAFDEGFAASEEIPWTPIGQGFRDMSPCIETFETLLLNKKLAHGNHPLLNLGAANAIAIRDPAGNRKTEKAKSTGRIDPLVAAIMSVHLCVAPPEGEEAIEHSEADFFF